MCVPSNVKPGPATVPAGAKGATMGRTPVYTEGTPETYGSRMAAAPAAPAMPTAAADTAGAVARGSVDVSGRRIPTLPEQASDTARRAVAGEFRGAGKDGIPNGPGGGKGRGRGPKEDLGDEPGAGNAGRRRRRIPPRTIQPDAPAPVYMAPIRRRRSGLSIPR
jgi:hypothetical protein